MMKTVRKAGFKNESQTIEHKAVGAHVQLWSPYVSILIKHLPIALVNSLLDTAITSH